MRKQPVLGILTLYLNDSRALEERSVYEKMTVAGRRLGLPVVVFTPEDVNEFKERVYAYMYHPGNRVWRRRWIPIPSLIYDRCRYQKSTRFAKLLDFRRKYPHLTYLSRPLRNKWTLYRMLSSVPEFRRHLPSTRLYRSPDDIAGMMKKFPTVYFKPINGTGGRGILRIDRLRDGTCVLQGRNHARMIVQARRVPRANLAAVIRTWDRHGDRYIVQQGLNIKLPGGQIHDYRMLAQKNGNGEWEVTGCAGRVGPRHSITSNLHGGGSAFPMQTLLRQWVEDEEQIGQIRQTAESFGLAVAKQLEKTYGGLCELALDLAIDRKGRVWLLEVNPKPAREVFIQAGEKKVYRRAITRPIEYALWAYRQRKESRTQQRTEGLDNRGELADSPK